VFLAEPPPTQADVHFRLLGIPVRIHPFFWLVTLLLGLRGTSTPPGELVAWAVAVLVSILVHELGHALLQRHFGGRPRITLHGMGGLAICNDCDRSPRSQILISLAGPLAGFLLLFLLMVGLNLTGHQAGWVVFSGPSVQALRTEGFIPLSIFGTVFYWQPFEATLANHFVWDVIQINLLWGIVNLLPIYPLDGGQISREVCQMGHPRKGILLSLQISIAFAVLMAFVGLSWGSLYTAFLFGYLGYSSYKTLQAYQASRW